jgi:hypothetical protein
MLLVLYPSTLKPVTLSVMDSIPWDGYPLDEPSDSLDWAEAALALSPGSGLRKLQIVGSILIAGSKPRLRLPEVHQASVSPASLPDE